MTMNSIPPASHTAIQAGLAYHFQDFLEKVKLLSADLSEDEFWTNPYPYGNSIGNLALHLTGNLNYYMGTQLAATGYERNRPREFNESERYPKAEVLAALEAATALTVQVLKAQSPEDWATPYSAVGVDDVHDRISIFLRCVAHFNHHVGHMNYTHDELLHRRNA